MLLALFLFGPERLPGLVQDTAKAMRQACSYLAGVTQELQAELGRSSAAWTWPRYATQKGCC